MLFISISVNTNIELQLDIDEYFDIYLIYSYPH